MTNTISDRIHKATEELFDDIVGVRRHIHQYPELSFKEEKTGQFIADQLRAWQIPHTTGWAGHGVVATINGDAKGPTIALRADIDALPILEKNEVEYKSRNEGIMHACGHDVHTSSLLGAARILNGIKDELPGTIQCIFQPGEERLPGGASIMIEEGVFNEYAPAHIIGQHVHPPLQVGKVGFKQGQYMASADEIYITIIGRGGHGALPQDCVDPVTIMAQVISALQQIVSRNSNPLTPSVLTIGKVNTVGGATNIIPNQVKMEGTFRTFDEKWRAEAHHLMETLVRSVCKAMGGSCDFEVKKGYPFLYNDPEFTEQCYHDAESFLGVQNVVELPMRTTAEDFSFYSQILPGCFYRLGTGNIEKNITSPVHTDTFDIDEDALRVGMGLMAFLAYRSLNTLE